MKPGVTAGRFSPPLPLPQGERIEVRGFEIARIVSARTLTLPLSLWKGEATSPGMQNHKQSRALR
jgi:hypothetical protein